jgi:hypothetical protein
MAYRKYTAPKIKSDLDLKQSDLFSNLKLPIVEASRRLLETLEVSQKMAITTEKAVCEQLVAPILTEIKLQNEDVVLFSGEQLNVDKRRNLNGEIDFLFAKTANYLTIESPILCITEAKIGLIDKGIPQAAAQMFAVRLFNEKEKKTTPIIYGAVTDGRTWRFLKLEKQILHTDLKIVHLDNLPLLLGTLQWIIDFYKDKVVEK